MCKFESSQKDESRWQSTDSSKAYRNTSAFKCGKQTCRRELLTDAGKASSPPLTRRPLRRKQQARKKWK